MGEIGEFRVRGGAGSAGTAVVVRFRAVVAPLLAGAVLSGCTASASMKGSTSAGNAGGGTQASVDLDEHVEVEVEPRRLDVGQIRFDEGGELRYGGQINFEYDRADLKTDSETSKVLESFREFLESHPDVSLRVEGHTDSRGSDDYNRKLSDRRASAVRQWLEDQGIDTNRVTSEGLGEASPRVPEPAECDDKRPEDPASCEPAWKANRRVEFHVTRGAATITLASSPADDDEPEEEHPAGGSPAPPRPSMPGCPFLWGQRAEVLGPNAAIGGAFFIQPLCWLELSLGGSYSQSTSDAEASVVNSTLSPAIVSGTAGLLWINIPARARAWLGGRHAFLVDLGVGWSYLKVSGSEDNPPLSDFEYDQTGSAIFGSAGVGYGYRRPRGFRLGILLGFVGFDGARDDPDVSAQGWDPAVAAALRDALEQATDNAWETRPYVEASFGWAFE